MNPNVLRLDPTRCDWLDSDTEVALLSVPINDWEPVIVSGNRVIDGSQRVICARKHGLTYIPVIPLKAS